MDVAADDFVMTGGSGMPIGGPALTDPSDATLGDQPEEMPEGRRP